jgi:chaperonin GroEL (HSP60 family)
MNTDEIIIDYTYNYLYNYNNNYILIYNNNSSSSERVDDNLNIIIKEMEQLDEIKEDMTTQDYLDKSNSLYKRYNDLKRRLGN